MDSDVNSGADHLVELIVREEPPSIVDDVPISEEIAPLLTQIEKPKINIFTISYPRRKPMVTFHTTYFFFNNFDQQFPPLFPILVAEMWKFSISFYLCYYDFSCFYLIFCLLCIVFSVKLFF